MQTNNNTIESGLGGQSNNLIGQRKKTLNQVNYQNAIKKMSDEIQIKNITIEDSQIQSKQSYEITHQQDSKSSRHNLVINQRSNVVVSNNRKRLKSPPQILNINLNLNENMKPNNKVTSPVINEKLDSIKLQKDLKQKIRMHSPQNMMNINIIQNLQQVTQTASSNKVQFKMHSPQNIKQVMIATQEDEKVVRNNSKGPLIQKNKFPKVFGEYENIKNIILQKAKKSQQVVNQTQENTCNKVSNNQINTNTSERDNISNYTKDHASQNSQQRSKLIDQVGKQKKFSIKNRSREKRIETHQDTVMNIRNRSREKRLETQQDQPFNIRNRSREKRVETQQDVVTNHEINWNELQKYQITDVDGDGEKKKKKKIDIADNNTNQLKLAQKSHKQKTFEKAIQSLQEENKPTLKLKSRIHNYQLNQVITIKNVYQSEILLLKKVLHVKSIELLWLLEVKLSDIKRLSKFKEYLQLWKCSFQMENQYAVQIKEVYWNQPEHSLSILSEQFKHFSIKSIISQTGSLNTKSMRSIAQTVIKFVSTQQETIKFANTHQLINIDNIYFNSDGQMKIGINCPNFLNGDHTDPYRKNFQQLNHNIMSKQQQFRESSMDKFKTNSYHSHQVLSALGLVLLECFLGEDVQYFREVDCSSLQRTNAHDQVSRIQHKQQQDDQQFCCFLHNPDKLSVQLNHFKQQLNDIFGPNVLEYLFIRLNMIDQSLLDFLCTLFSQKDNYSDIFHQIEQHMFLNSEESYRNYNFNQNHHNSLNTFKEVIDVCQEDRYDSISQNNIQQQLEIEKMNTQQSIVYSTVAISQSHTKKDHISHQHTLQQQQLLQRMKNQILIIGIDNKLNLISKDHVLKEMSNDLKLPHQSIQTLFLEL